MKITFPHLGDAHIAARLLLTEIGVDVVAPPLCTRKTLELGTAVSPEEICFPFKLMAGNLIEAWNLGADTVVMPATMGPCRLGEYAELLNSVLTKYGCNFQWIVIDSPGAIGIRELLKRLARVTEGRTVSAAAALHKAFAARRLIEELDNLCAEASWLCGYLEEPQKAKTLLRFCRAELGIPTAGDELKTQSAAQTLNGGRKIIQKYKKELEMLPLKMQYRGRDRIKEDRPLHVILTGEIYTLIEPYANHHLEELLMDMGISFRKRVSISWWINHTAGEAVRGILPGRSRDECSYFPCSIGGYAKETVEETLQCARDGFDGVIQALPVGCMPEIVAKAALHRISQDQALSILSVIFDELDGQAGYVTRIEAFIDMLERKKALNAKTYSRGEEGA